MTKLNKARQVGEVWGDEIRDEYKKSGEGNIVVSESVDEVEFSSTENTELYYFERYY